MCLLKRISLSISDLNTLFPFHFSYFHFSCFRFSCFSGDTAGANKARSRIGEKIEKVAEKIEKTGGTLLDPVFSIFSATFSIFSPILDRALFAAAVSPEKYEK